MRDRISMFRRYLAAVKSHRQEIYERDVEIRDLQRCVLVHQKAMIELAVAFRIALEQPEIDIRDDLESLIRELSDGVAHLEEFVT